MKIAQKAGSVLLAFSLGLSSSFCFTQVIYAEDTVTIQTNENQYQIFEDENLYYKVQTGNRAEVVGVKNTSASSLSIPAEVSDNGQTYEVVKIDSMVFMGMSNLKSVSLPKTMEEIAEAAFISNPSLQEVFFSAQADRAVLVRSGAFENCPKLETVVLPDFAVDLEENVFYGTHAVALYRYTLDSSADLDLYSPLYMGLYESRDVQAVSAASSSSTPPDYVKDNSFINYKTNEELKECLKTVSPGWIVANGSYRYINPDGNFVKCQMLEIGENTYYFDAGGNLYTGWISLDGIWHYFNKDGTLAEEDWIEENYYTDSIWQNYGWIETDGGWMFGQNGKSQLKDQWMTINGLKYYFDENGMMATGWLELTDGTYYLRNDGTMITDGYQGSAYLDVNGRRDSRLDKPNWITENNQQIYQFAGGTRIREGWVLAEDEQEYYFDINGYMQTGWIECSGQWYYADENTGAMLKNEWVGGCYLDARGIWSDDQWISDSNGKKYKNSNGTYAKGWTTINGREYYFDANGYLLTGWQKISGKWYFLEDSGSEETVNLSSKYTWDGSSWSYKSSPTTLHGVDISHWQDGIDVSVIPADFIIAKATGGTGYADENFHAYAKAAKSSGKLFGMYHFARDRGYEGDARAEAEYFYSVVKDYIGWGVPILDWESDLHLGPEWCMEFIERFYELSGVKCVLYTSVSVTRSYDWSEAAAFGVELWMAQYPNMESVVGYDEDPWTDSYGTGAFSSALMHQYTSQGKLPGYDKNLDLDIFYGSASDWKKLAAKS